jgi:hypothetical protein
MGVMAGMGSSHAVDWDMVIRIQRCNRYFGSETWNRPNDPLVLRPIRGWLRQPPVFRLAQPRFHVVPCAVDHLWKSGPNFNVPSAIGSARRAVKVGVVKP